MKSILDKSVFILLFVMAASASAQDIITYKYDALGRLVLSERRATRSGSQTEYTYDAASNRKTVRSSGPFKAEWLNSGDALLRGEVMLSYDRRHTFTLQFDGNLVLYDQAGTALWNLGTQGSASDRLIMQPDGNLVLYAGTQPIWNTGTAYEGSRFAVQDDGNIVIYSPANGPVWDRYGCC